MSLYEAFNSINIVEKLNYKIESIFSNDKLLYVGTSSGTLLIYECLQVEDKEASLYTDEFGQFFNIELKKELKNFSRKAIEQIDYIKEIGSLVILTDNAVNLYDVHELTLLTQFPQSKGAGLFSLNSGVELLNQETKKPDPDGIPSLTTRLCISVKRKLFMVVWSDSEYMGDLCVEYALPDRVRNINFVSSTKICISLSKEMIMLDLISGKLEDMFQHPPPSSSGFTGDLITGASSITSSLTEFGLNAAMSTINYKGYKPPMLKLNDKELVITKDDKGVFINSEGSSIRDTSINWGGYPYDLGFSFPYLIGVLPKSIEVRNSENFQLVQTIDIQSSFLITKSKQPYIASTTGIWKLIPTHFANQINELTSKKFYSEALTLLDLNRDRITEIKTQSVKQIQTLHAYDLFYNKKFDDSFNLFRQVEAEVKWIVSLFPDKITGSEFDREMPDFMKEISIVKTKSNEENNEKEKDKDAGKDKDKNISEDQETDKKPWEMVDEETLLSAECLTSLTKYLTDTRTSLNVKILHNENPSPQTSPKSNSSLSPRLAPPPPLSLNQLTQAASLTDTTLVRVYLINNPNLIGPLLRVKNYCKVNQVEKILMKEHKYKELFDLYYTKELHRKSLTLLSKLNQSEDKEVPAPFNSIDPIIQYLQKLGNSNLDLILEFSSDYLQSSPDEAMEVFTLDSTEVEKLNRDKVLAHLVQISPQLGIKYLNHIITYWKDVSTKFHNSLANLYLDCIENSPSGFSNIDTGLMSPTIETSPELNVQTFYHQLLTFLKSSNYYRPEKILGRLPTEGLWRVRVVLLSRMNLHKQALHILVHRLQSYSEAEQYCCQIKTPEVFCYLLQEYLDPEITKLPLIDPAVELMIRYGGWISTYQALTMLPPTVPMKTLLPFFEKSLRGQMRIKDSNSIYLNLLKGEKLKIQNQVINQQSKSVSINENTLCRVCLKRIGTSVLVIYPNQMVVHYSCQNKFEAGVKFTGDDLSLVGSYQTQGSLPANSLPTVNSLI